MKFLERKLLEITQITMESLVGMEALPTAELNPKSPAQAFSSSVQILGAWQGTAAIQCSPDLTTKITKALFALPEEEDPDEDLAKDALAEIANVIGGNIKGLMPQGCTLSLPTVTRGLEPGSRFPNCEPFIEVNLECAGHPMAVLLLKHQQALN